jgi:FkbM family methyltransferase
MLSRLNKLVTGAARRASLYQLGLLGPKLRAQVLEQAVEETVSVTEVPKGRILFFAPATKLLFRAETVMSKETDTIQWIDGFTDEGVFWDIGANAGVYSLYAGVSKRVRVLSFEPSAANFHALSKNIQLNQLSDRVTAYCVALSGETKLGVLNMSSSLMGASISQFGQLGEMSRYWEGYSGAAFQGMIGFSIDDFVKQFNPPFPNYIKIDVDGLELPILMGAQTTLRDPRLRSLIVELSVSDKEEYAQSLAFLEDAGFSLVSQGGTQGTQTERAANHLLEKVVPPTLNG